MKKIPFIILMMVIFACDDDTGPNTSYDPSYFPLHVGDVWNYIPASNLQYPDVPSITSEIKSTVKIDNLEYYLMVSEFDYPDESHVSDSKESTFYRLGDDGFVYALKTVDDLLSNPYRLGAMEGEEWKYITPISDEGKVIVTRVESVMLNNTNVEACKTYYYDVERMADEEHYSILAPGLGIIKQGTAWGFDTILKRAVIDGKEFEF